MKKTKKVKVLTKEDSLMKVVLDELSVKTSPIISEKKSFDFRDIFWNYPEFLVNSFKKLIPVSYILLFGLVALLIILFLNTSTFTRTPKNKKYVSTTNNNHSNKSSLGR